MQTPAKYLLGVAGVALSVTIFLVVRNHDPVAASARNSSQVEARVPPLTKSPTTEVNPGQPTTLAVSNDEMIIPPLPADATFVPDADLLKLSALVNLPNAEERHIDKDQWGRALPIAQKLVQGPCDCEQRNWLVHFIEMGNNALAGSDDDYYRLAGAMRKMARNDKQLENDPAYFAR